MRENASRWVEELEMLRVSTFRSRGLLSWYIIGSTDSWTKLTSQEGMQKCKMPRPCAIAPQMQERLPHQETGPINQLK